MVGVSLSKHVAAGRWIAQRPAIRQRLGERANSTQQPAESFS
jgi:hypothetical protein